MNTISKNKYVRRAKISEYKFRKMLKYFAEDLSATQIAVKTAINRNTVNRYLNEIRHLIVEFCEEYAPFNELNQDKAALKKSASLSTKISNNLGIWRRRGKIYSNMLVNLTADKLRLLLNAKKTVRSLSIHAVAVNEDCGLIAIGYDNNQQFANQPSHVANLDKFWEFIRSRTSKFQGIAQHKFYLHLKESEFRFNFRNENLYEVILKLLSIKPIT